MARIFSCHLATNCPKCNYFLGLLRLSCKATSEEESGIADSAVLIGKSRRPRPVLRQSTPADLKERWRVLYGSEPPRRISRDLLLRALAYLIQERALGGLKPSMSRLLAKVAADASERDSRGKCQAMLRYLPELSAGGVLSASGMGRHSRDGTAALQTRAKIPSVNYGFSVSVGPTSGVH
jgi:hypothetical protein